ncbi:MAG: DUF1501 domain-containing protein [Haliscomenobacteraceae bacterium CHB4]|nr:hypothetical protein [Saprospiraceae bacterium]MCE7924145.1 DUF1501 domain-containing protein [Haliscomenobacteraceae bacterium CHB4]
MLIQRRDFIKTGSLATASLLLPKFLKAFETPGSLPQKGKTLVVLQFSGGNDGLNTVVPVRNDIYYKERPRLAIKREEALPLSTEAGLNPALPGLKYLYDSGDLAILNSVGYPNPDRSHFRSMDIWHSASPSNEYWQTGWLGRYLDAQCAGSAPAHGSCSSNALEIDDTLSLVLKGNRVKGLAMQDAQKLYNAARSPYFTAWSNAHGAAQEDDTPVEYLYKTMAETLSSADYLYQQIRKKPSAAAYPLTGLGKSLKTIASLILADTGTAVYYVSLGSFDTHINQQGQQKRLFTELNDALAAFTKDMKSNGKWNEVLVLTFSEFGRRVSQNASGGTDHGTANQMFFMSGALKEKGLLNPLPDLTDLDNGDLKFKVDFRQVYATLLENWLGADPKAVLKEKFEVLTFV